MQLSDFASRAGEWLSGSGPDSDLVISSRIRLARNVSEQPFLSRASSRQRSEISEQLQQAVGTLSGQYDLDLIQLKGVDSIDRHVLMERHLISREHAFAKGDRAVAFNANESTSIMINEEDHLRIQVMRSGFQLRETWQAMDQLDDELEKRVPYAFDEKFGYLTVCPTNVGTGLRASVMLHLPALVMTRQIEKVFQAVSKINLAVRGLYGEGTQALGDFYQISNQTTLGRSEREIVENISSVIPEIIRYERNVRQTLLDSKKDVLEDKIWRAYGVLSTARIVSSKETLENLSLVRLGVHIGILNNLTAPMINELFILTQPGHLQKTEGVELESLERDIARARFIRKFLEQSARETESS